MHPSNESDGSDDADFRYLQRSLKICENELPLEIRNHSVNHNTIAQRHVLAKSKLAEVDQQRKRCFAERAKFVRGQPREGRATDKFVEAEVELDPAYQKAIEAVAVWKLEVGRWEALRESSTQRSFMFKELVSLEAAGLARKRETEEHTPPPSFISQNRAAASGASRICSNENSILINDTEKVRRETL